MEKITTYLCDKLSGTVGYEPFDGDIPGIEVVGGLVKASLWPETPAPGCQSGAGKITAQLLTEDDSRYVCFPVEDLLTWERKEIEYEHNPVGLEDYITIEIENSDHCHWIESEIKIYGADFSIFGRVFGRVDVGAGGQPCPANKKDVFSGGGISTLHLLQNTIVPGERIELRWKFWDGQNLEDISVDVEWFCTCCFTGGIVKAVNGEYGDADITYTVEIQGINRTCVPSDFVEYEVGDWVFILAPNSSCEECGRINSCKAGCDDASNYIILPLRIGDYGP